MAGGCNRSREGIDVTLFGGLSYFTPTQQYIPTLLLLSSPIGFNTPPRSKEEHTGLFFTALSRQGMQATRTLTIRFRQFRQTCSSSSSSVAHKENSRAILGRRNTSVSILGRLVVVADPDAAGLLPP